MSIDKLFRDIDVSGPGRDLIGIAGGHPRTLESVRDVVLANRNGPDYMERARFKELFMNVINKNKGSRLGNDGKTLVAAAICSRSVGRGVKIMSAAGSAMLSADDARRKGYCSYLVNTNSPERFTPVLTPFQMIIYFVTLEDTKGFALLDSLRSQNEQSSFTGQPFETFHAVFECFYRGLWVDSKLERPDTILIRSLYGTGATFSSQFSNSSVTLHGDYYYDMTMSTFVEYFISKNRLAGTIHRCYIPTRHTNVGFKVGGLRYLTKPAILRFNHSNPGFDSVIVAPNAQNPRQTHLTFIETRYTAQASKNHEPLAHYRNKYSLLRKDLDKLLKISRKDGLEIMWHYVYAIYRDTCIQQDQLKENTILLNRNALNALYGPSLNCLGML